MFQFMVSIGVDAVVVSVDERTLSNIIAAVREELPQTPIVEEHACIVQLFDPEWKAFINVKDFATIPDRSKLNILMKPPPQVTTPPLVATPPPTPVETTVHTLQLRPPPTTVEEQMQLGKPFPLVYNLPDFGTDLTKLMIEKPEEVISSYELRQEILKIIYDDLKRYENGYPTDRAFRTCLGQFIHKFEKLSDKHLKENAGRCNVNPYGTWHNSLVNKFKYNRSKVHSNLNPLMAEMRRKYGRKRTAPDADLNKEEQLQVAPRLPSQSHLQLPDGAGLGEDESTYASHKRFIKTEWAKRTPDLDAVKTRMRLTAAHRAELYTAGVEKLLAEFPLLCDKAQLIADCKLLCNIDFTQKREAFMAHSAKVDYLYQQTKRKPAAKNVPVGSVDSAEQKEAAVLTLLPLLFAEPAGKPGSWLVINQPVTEPHPVVGLNNAAFTVYLDKIAVCSNASSLAEALDVLISIIYLFNTEFPPKLKKFYRFYTEVICLLPCKKPLPITIQRVINTLDSIPDDSAEEEQHIEEDN